MIELSVLLADEQCLWKAILKLAHQSAEIIALVEKPAPGFDLPLDVHGPAFQQWGSGKVAPCRLENGGLAVGLRT
jgi:hypothetical protein